MDKETFKARTKAFALRVIRLVEALPKKNLTAEVKGLPIAEGRLEIDSHLKRRSLYLMILIYLC